MITLAEDQVNYITDYTRTVSPQQISDELTPVIVQLSSEGDANSQKVAEAVFRYLEAVQRYQTYDGIYQEQEAEQRVNMKAEIEASLNNTRFWQDIPLQDGKYDKQEVTTAFTPNNEGVFVVSKPDESGLVAIVRNDGTKDYANISELEDVTTEDIDVYLSRAIMTKRRQADAVRMEEEIVANMLETKSNTRVGDTVDISGQQFVITGTTSDRVFAQPVEGGEVIELPWEDFGQATGMVQPVLTQEEKDQLEAEEILSEDTSAINEDVADNNEGPIPMTALSRIPVDASGNPIYEETDSDTAWDAIVEQTDGDEEMAQTVADGMVADKEESLKVIEKTKSKGGVSIAEKIASEKERKDAIDAARKELEMWKRIAATSSRRKMEAEAERRHISKAAMRKAEEERLKAEREESERIEREALNGVPDMADDKPQDARARGYRRVNGNKVDRQTPIESAVVGNAVSVKFSNKDIANGHATVIDATQLQPSHIQGQRNPLHFIDEAQPKERNDEVSIMSANQIAENIRPEEITSSVTAFTGAPTVNTRGEAIQGNSRSDALRTMWNNNNEQAAKYKQYLIEHAQEFGLDPAAIEAMEHPVLVNMIDVDDNEAIRLGQFIAQDTESGGVERIKPKNAVQKIGSEMGTFANMLLASSDDETSFSGLVDRNGHDVLRWMNQRGYITPTQYTSAFDSKGNISAEAKNDLKGIMYQSIFKDGNTRLEEMFNAMPAKAQRAILATAYRDYDSPNSERMLKEIQDSIRVFHILMQDADFAESSNWKEARYAADAWKIQYAMDDVTGESYLPAENFSNFAILLATMYKGEKQSFIQSTFNKLYDLIQGTQEENLFEQPDNTPRTLVQAIKETLNIDYDGQHRSNVLGDNSETSQRGQRGSDRNAQTGERDENEERAAGSGRGFIQTDLERRGQGDLRHTSRRQQGDLAQAGEIKAPSLFQYFTGTLSELIAQAKQSAQGLIKKVIAPISSRLKNDLNSQGLQIDDDYNHVIDNNAIRHIIKKHSGKNEEKRGQIPITDADFENIADVVEHYDGVEVVPGNTSAQRIIYHKVYQDGTVIYVEEQRVGRKELAAVTMWKKKNLNLTDANRTETTLISDLTEVPDNKDTANSPKANELGEKVAQAEAEVDVNPTDKQKEAGNYKKGHIQVGSFNVTIENPKGSVRSGVDANGKKWETEMRNTYGYIRGTEGVDGDHIDVFLSDDIDGWNGRRVFVVDQYNEDGSFDEHKVMLGFNETDDAEAAYFANYDNDWAKKRKTVVTGVNLEDFKKWVDSSHRKTKPFAEYQNIKSASKKEKKETISDNLQKHNNGANDENSGKEYHYRMMQRPFGIGTHPEEGFLRHEKDGSTFGSVIYDHPLSRAEVTNFSLRPITEAKDLEGKTFGIPFGPNTIICKVLEVDNDGMIRFVVEGEKEQTLPYYQFFDNIGEDAKELDNRATNASTTKEESGDIRYTITPSQYTTKRGKVLDMQLVTLNVELSKDEFRSANAFAKKLKGWYDAKKRGFLMRSEEDARALAKALISKEGTINPPTKPELAEADKNNVSETVEDIFQMAERIAKEEEEKRNVQKKSSIKTDNAEKELVSLEQWQKMNGEDRMQEAGKHPLLREEIENASSDDVLKANALDYLNGNQGIIQSVSYLKVYEDVRYSNGNSAADSGTADKTQLDEANTGSQQGLDGTSRGSRGVSSELLDRKQGEGTLPGDRGLVQHSPDSEKRNASDVGKGSDSNVSGEEQPVGRSSVRSGERRGSSYDSRNGRNGKQRGTGRSNQGVGNDRERGSETDRRGNSQNGGSQSLSEDIDSFLADAMEEFDSVLDEFNRAGQEELSMSLVGMSSRQMVVLPRLIAAGAKVGYAYLKKGIHNFAEWAKQMRKVLGGKLADAGLSENEIESFITEMWKSKLPIDGEIHTLEEWSSILGKAALRKKVGESLEEKRRAQDAAELIAVKVCDRDNIAETLPFLLPQQQEDVLKAETQFFDESHNDRDHAFGKGYMFTNGTGTGKTYTGLGIVKRFIKQGKGRVLVLTPSQTKVKDWVKDAKNLGIELNDLDVVAKSKKDGTTATTEKGEGAVITTYANFRQNKALLEDLFDLIVYDESHRLLENKEGTGTAGSLQHYKLSNRNEQYAYLRLQEIDPTWNALNAKMDEFNTERGKLIERLKKEYGITNELTLGQRGELPPVFNGNWMGTTEQKFPKLAKLRNEVKTLDAKYNKDVKPELERQAKANMKHTKVVFLSATPFNTRENLDYAEGYIFSYPEQDKPMGFANQSPRSQFYLEHFGAGYRWRYNRLESSTSNPEAVAKQEVELSEYLQHTLQTMSGRIIDSPYDYSRDFPTVTMEKAEAFNAAMEELSRDESTRAGYSEVMGDYNYSSALFESMKVSQIIPRLKAHLERGRKVVVFHRRVDSREPLRHPFAAIFAESAKAAENEYDAKKKAEKKKRIASLKRKYAELLVWEQGLDLRMPREQLADAFGKADVLFFSGKESEKVKNKAVKDFNSDTSGKNIMVIQEASGKEGISLHDTTGEHQRVLVTLALPQSPITALQIEGRIYRIGNKSNAIFEYPLLGLNAEMMLFGQKFNQQVSTTENLALGLQARNLRESFARGVEEHSGDVDIDGQGVGGKELDAPGVTETDAFDRAVLDYYTNQKLTGRRDSRAGQDYYPTPEPLGYMMNQWGWIGEGDSVLEPSAGHGAIARYVPRENPLTAVEPSQSLFSKLQIKAGGNGRKFENDVFENYNVVNKHDVVLMNPPFGTGGRMAVDHVAKAFQHLEEGGRIVAIIPRGSTDKKFDKWYEEQKNAVLTAEIGLPDITFERAGTSVNCRVVVIDKVTNKSLRSDAASRAVHLDLSSMHFDKIEDFFEEIRDIRVPERTIDYKAKMKKKAASVARELRGMKGIRKVDLNEDRIFVDGRGVWASLQWGDWQGDALLKHLSEEYVRFRKSEEYAIDRDNKVQTEVYGELKELCCKLAGMTEDEMQRYVDRSGKDEGLRFREGDLDEVNKRFNEELDGLTEENAQNVILDLGRPGDILLGAGLSDREIRLYGNKVMKKIRKHGFDISSIRNLPIAINNPIAVFNNYGNDSNRAILTELKTEQGNVLATIEWGKGTDAELNIVTSVFGKGKENVVGWFNKGYATYINKEKALSYLRIPAPIAGAQDNQELSSATKVVKDFVNPSVDSGNLREGDAVYTNDELSYENAPIAKVTGKQRETVQSMAQTGKEVAEKLHLDNVDIVTDTANLEGKQKDAKGFYNTKTGKITIVVPNHRDAQDVIMTVLHEAVGHKGLRHLVGDKEMDKFTMAI